MASSGRLSQHMHCGRQIRCCSWQRALRQSPALRYMPARGASWPAKHACLRLCRCRPHPLWPVEVSRQTKARSSSDFFDRQTERSLLLGKLKQRPKDVLVVVGPRSSGKSRLLEEVLVAKKKHELLVALVDGRSQKLTDAGIMAGVLRDQGAGLVRQIKNMGILAEAGTSIKLMPNIDLKSLAPALEAALKFFEKSTPCSLNNVIAAYGSLLNLSKPRLEEDAPWPVICIDEANVLMKWYRGGAAMEDDLDALLGFFVQADAHAHYLGVAAELGDQFFTAVVVGDFSEAEARLYLEQCMGSSIADHEWAGIFEVCGGNAGSLLRAAGNYAELNDWTWALGEIWRKPMDTVVSGLTGGFPWTTAQYRTVLRLISESYHGAVIAQDTYLELGPGGKQAVQAMVKANLISYRPQSGWARDIPLKAFGPDRLPVVTAPSATHLYCMRRLLQRGSLSSTAQAASSPPPAALQSSPLEQQLKNVEQQLKDVVDKIDEVDRDINDLRSAKPENWQDEVKQLRDEKKQLRKKEEQLREKELLLLRKSDT